MKGEIFANIWQTDYIARIAPDSGTVTGYIDLRGLLSSAERADAPTSSTASPTTPSRIACSSPANVAEALRDQVGQPRPGRSGRSGRSSCSPSAQRVGGSSVASFRAKAGPEPQCSKITPSSGPVPRFLHDELTVERTRIERRPRLATGLRLTSSDTNPESARASISCRAIVRPPMHEIRRDPHVAQLPEGVRQVSGGRHRQDRRSTADCATGVIISSAHAPTVTTTTRSSGDVEQAGRATSSPRSVATI